jgi:TPR repeat protein
MKTVAILIFLIIPFLTFGQTKRVTAVGYGNTHEKQLQDAFITAIQNAGGVYIENSLIIENGQIVSDKTVSKTVGFVESYTITNRYKDSIVIEAVVNEKIPQNKTKEAADWYAKAANDNYAVALVNLGAMYEMGQGVPQSYQKARELYTEAAKQGLASAQCNLGYIYAMGNGVQKNYKKAAEWYLKAANQGFDRAQNNLGVIYYEGVAGVPQDYKKAAEWYTKAANQGFAESQYNLGLMYDKGGSGDYKKAAEWYAKAANQGLAQARYNLGVMYDNGDGVPQDPKRAAELYKEAANQGHALAQYNLGISYISGDGVDKDTVTGCAWIYISKNSKGGAHCDKILTQPQMTRALYLMDEFKKGIKD